MTGATDAWLRSDGHVHSTFSDGVSTPEDNLAAAVRAGLDGLVMVDHVRASTTWLPDFVGAVRTLRRGSPIEVVIGVETKILDTAGHLDLPDHLAGIERVLIADHRFPGPDGPLHPADVADQVRSGSITPQALAEDLVAAMVAAIGRAPAPAVLAHPFSILPKVGLSEADVPPDAIRALAACCRASGAAVEVNEKWSCPGSGIVRVLLDEHVPIVAGSDAHDAEAVGRWDSVRSTLAAAVAASDGREMSADRLTAPTG